MQRLNFFFVDLFFVVFITVIIQKMNIVDILLNSNKQIRKLQSLYSIRYQ